MQGKWLGLSIALHLLIQALTYFTVTADSDDFLRSRLSSPLALIQRGCLHDQSDRPIDQRPECRVPDPFVGMTGDGCRWWVAYPMLSCRVGGVPITLLGRPRYGGGHELVVTLLSKALGPTGAATVAIGAAKLGVVFLLFWIIRLFRLPMRLLPFLVINPLFQMLGQHSWHFMVSHLILLYLSFCLVFSEGRRKFLGGLVSLAAACYVYASIVFAMFPAVVLLGIRRKTRRRAVLVAVAAGLCLIAWVAVSCLHPTLRRELALDLADPPLRRSLYEYWAYLVTFYDAFSLHDQVPDYLTPATAVAPGLFSFSSALRLAGFGVFSMLIFSGFVLKEKGSKTVRALIALFVASGVLFLSIGGYFVARVLTFLPIALIASYLGAETLGGFLRKKGAKRFASIPMVWLWATALLSCGHFIATFAPTHIPLLANADYFARLGQRLSELGVHAPFATNGPLEMGLLDVFSGESVRPLYVNAHVWGDSPELNESDPVGPLLAPWTRLSRGTLLQKSVENLAGRNILLGLPELRKFAQEHAIEIRRAEFFPYRGNEGHWIIDFVNHRWLNKS